MCSEATYENFSMFIYETFVECFFFIIYLNEILEHLNSFFIFQFFKHHFSASELSWIGNIYSL